MGPYISRSWSWKVDHFLIIDLDLFWCIKTCPYLHFLIFSNLPLCPHLHTSVLSFSHHTSFTHHHICEDLELYNSCPHSQIFKSHAYKTLVRPTLEYCSMYSKGPTYCKTCFAATGGSIQGYQIGEEWQHPAEYSQPDAHRPSVTGAGPDVNRGKTLPDIQDSPQLHPDRNNKIC